MSHFESPPEWGMQEGGDGVLLWNYVSRLYFLGKDDRCVAQFLSEIPRILFAHETLILELSGVDLNFLEVRFKT